MPKLVISLPDAGEVIHELVEAQLTIGRVEENTLQIDDASVSSHHAKMILRAGDYFLEDLGSTNGTRLNGAPVTGEEKKLKAGDRVQFGKVEAIYEATTAQAAARPLPQETAAVATPAASSQRPEGFGNASPFQRKRSVRNPVNTIAVAAGIVAIAAAAAAGYFVYSILPPQF
jgi:pSer/pThr/pTyr-binding forkhead associated (FHA) protein